jgi:hypothetical protein
LFLIAPPWLLVVHIPHIHEVLIMSARWDAEKACRKICTELYQSWTSDHWHRNIVLPGPHDQHVKRVLLSKIHSMYLVLVTLLTDKHFNSFLSSWLLALSPTRNNDKKMQPWCVLFRYNACLLSRSCTICCKSDAHQWYGRVIPGISMRSEVFTAVKTNHSQQMGAVNSSETLVTTYKTTWCHNLQDHNMNWMSYQYLDGTNFNRYCYCTINFLKISEFYS